MRDRILSHLLIIILHAACLYWRVTGQSDPMGVA